jgi:uncharacterized protein (TIGR02266 family)
LSRSRVVAPLLESMSTQQALVQAISNADDDLPTAKYAVLPEETEVVVIERAGSATGEVPALEVSLMVDLDSESNFYVGFAEDLSDGGIFVATHVPRKIGSRVDLAISLPNEKPMRANGTVKWVREYSDAIEGVPGMGIQFDRLSRQDVERILEFARGRPPMFFDGEILVAERVATP